MNAECSKNVGPSDQVRLARAYLLRVVEPPGVALGVFVEQVGPVEAAAAVRSGEAPRQVVDETSARQEVELAHADLERAAGVGGRLVVPEDDEWPAWPLLSLTNARGGGARWAAPPLGLWVRGAGSLDDVVRKSVAVVGARSATGYGEHVATEFGYELAERAVTVISGAAFGVDGAAHRGALAAKGTTVAVLACGVDVPYPAAHTSLIDRVARDGAVVSEYPPGTTPAKYRFLVRNRLIAALSQGTVVVEAGVRSGARNTATSAAALGKPVLAVPGQVGSAMSRGCHEMIRAGTATLVNTVDEVLEAVGEIGDLAPGPSAPRRPTDGLGKQAARVHDALSPRESRGAEWVARESGVPLDRVRALLPELELTGLARRGEDGWSRERT
ncbi:DNA-processing protein DprA [Actinokineospora enzanensis]|uniref:DNA-processing protein DprA n=1 Tax=Actinokineospora enzanensis TaxID=155975 RepID=UPI00035C6073|nr:DNA-processing protein DprA [Actinokineospora enzanensis]